MESSWVQLVFKGLKSWCGLCLALALPMTWLGSVASAQPGQQARSHRVLVLNSYHPQYEWTQRVVEGIREGLEGSVSAENLHIEYMDSRRFVDQPAYLQELVSLYRYKYGERQPDVILSSDDSALAFLREHRSSLFAGVPVVFLGINATDPAAYAGLDGFTGILEGLDVQSNLDLIRTVHPDVERVVVLSDSTSLGQAMAASAAPALSGLREHGVSHEVWDDFTLKQLYTRVGRLGPRDVLLMLAIHQDRNGAYFSFDEHLPVLSERASRPIYGMFGMLLGKGVLGGAQNAPRRHGRNAAALARRILTGTPVKDIEVTVERYLPRFDARQLDRFDVPREVLPPDSEVLFEPRSLWREYRAEVTIVGVFLLALLGMVVALGISLRRQRQAEREVRRGELRLREAQKLETLGLLSSSIAHDFNNLLTPILGFAELARGQSRDNPDLDRHLSGIERAAKSAGELVAQLLALGRRPPSESVAVDLNALVDSNASLLRRTLRDEVSVTLELAQGVGKVEGSELERVLINLVVNAADAIDGHGNIWIRTRLVSVGAAEADRVGVCAGAFGLLEVCDDGCGISPQDSEHIFEPFFTTKGSKQGTGLGLATVYGIARRHGGTVSVSPRQPQGTCMRVYLPKARGAAGALPATIPPDQPLVPILQGSVLVVEDDDDVRAFVVEALEAAGFRVFEAASPGQALDWLDERDEGEPLDVLLTDVAMPHMNGPELAAEFARRSPATCTLYMSGHDAENAHDIPGPQLLRKPFSTATLVRRVSQLLDHARQPVPSTGAGSEDPRRSDHSSASGK